MIKTLKVILWDEEIGRLTWDGRRRTTYFMYNPTFIKKGLNIAPLSAPVVGVKALMPVWGDDSKRYQRLPPFIADSLPDAWGNQLFELWRQQNHLSNADVTPLDKLSFIGRRGMGALEFIPEVSRERLAENVNISTLAQMAERIFKEREEAVIMPDESVTMQSLLLVGTSAGGRQPKAIIAINTKTGEMRSGQVAGLADYDYYIVKFGSKEYDSAELEMTYYEMATQAGINMMHSELLTADGSNHFMTKRFDRVGGRKVHTQTLAAINPEADSYEQLLATCRKLHLPETDCQEIFRRLVFNVLANNTDDHNKNFSFVMDRAGNWRLSPAYDMTYILDTGGNIADEDHCMFVRAKLRGITREDVIAFAHDNGINRPDSVIMEVAEALKNFRTIATRYGVSSRWMGRVENTISNHLKEWGLLRGKNEMENYIVNGHSVANIRLELAYKGNYHLWADIDGNERKFVIGKNKEEYTLIEQTGITNVEEGRLLQMAIKYLLNDV